MPVHTGKDSKGCFAQWGSQKKYYYTCDNEQARDRAKKKAAKQGAAVRASGWTGNERGTRMLQTITANFTGLVRHDKMEGRDFLVAPMIMVVEGVLDGSEGPLLYPAEELGKTPAVWNHKPIIVYNPSRNGVGISACDPDILTNRKIGVIMNTTFEGDKLKAEAWLEEDRMNAVDERIADAVENQKIMELSTGVYTDNESMEGEWNGKPYVAIARNYRPDHLALLPDLKGACSVEDGAGFLRLNANPDKIKIIGNEMSHSNIRSLLNSWLQEKGDSIWIEEVYDAFFVYEDAGKLYKQNYSITDNEITVDTTVVEVIRVTEYRTKDGTFVGNEDNLNERKVEMNKKKLVDGLISNESTQWSEDDREALMKLDKNVLEKMAPVVNEEDANKAAVDKAAQAGGSDASPPAEEKTEAKAEEKPEEKATENKATTKNKKVLADEYINEAPEEIQGVLRSGLKSYKANKARLIKIITANKKNQFTEEQLNSKELTELQSLAALASETEEEQEEVNTLNFGGQGDAADSTEAEEKPLELPKMNFGKDKAEAAA